MHSQIPVIIIQAPVTFSDTIPYILVFVVYCLMVQVIFAGWKKFHEPSYSTFILVSIMAFLPAVSFLLENYLVLLVYSVFMSVMIYLSSYALKFTSNRNAPSIVFKAFRLIFLVTNHLTVTLQLLLIALYLLGKGGILTVLKLACYSVYFAVVSREIVRNLCVVMAHTTGYYSKEGVPGRSESDSNCMICMNALIPSNTDNNSNSNTNNSIITLQCGHRYHEDCIKGWCVIGQNNFCYYCKGGIDNAMFKQDYWIKSEVFIKPMMNAMRSVISFSVMIVGFLYFKGRL